jgi:hypothetical protein
MVQPFSLQIKNKIEAVNNLFDERKGMLDDGKNNGGVK